VKADWQSEAFGPNASIAVEPARATLSPPNPEDPTPVLADQVERLPLESLRELVFLEEAHDKGVIDDDSYLEQRQRILDGLR
jgi:hypothetical protein